MTDRSLARARALKRTLIASAALFATVFALLAAQLWLGNDPALGTALGTARATPQPEQDLHASVIDTVLGVASGLLDDEHGDEEDGGSSSVRSGTS